MGQRRRRWSSHAPGLCWPARDFSAIGDIADCNFTYTDVHSQNTRFVFLHRVAPGSVLGTAMDVDAYYDQIKTSRRSRPSSTLDPIIRWENS